MTVLSKSGKNATLGALCVGSSIISAAFIIRLVKIHKPFRRRNVPNLNKTEQQSRQRFKSQLRDLLKICVPTWYCKEMGYLALMTTMLIIRSMCDLWTIYIGTLLESSIINNNIKRFNKQLFQFALSMPTISLTTSLLKWSTESLQRNLRSRLTNHAINSYMQNQVYFKNSGHLLDMTSDIEKFTELIPRLYANLLKPMLDIVIYIYGISSHIGASVPTTMMSYLAIAASIIMKLRRPMANLVKHEQHAENQFRYLNQRIFTNAEEIAFYNGDSFERNVMKNSFAGVTNILADITAFKFVVNFFENFIAKYIATVVGYYSVSRPFFNPENPMGNSKERLEAYYKSGRMLLSLSQAIGRFVLNGKEVSRLTGYTSKVHDTMRSIKLANSSICSRPRVVHEDNVIRFDQVPIVTPNGDVLIKGLTLELTSGKNVLICGPNGCGKSSLFRILGELWPLTGGTLTKPTNEKLFYIPQKPYMPIGTLRDQIIYPDTYENMRMKGLTDEDLLELLRRVDLEWMVSDESNHGNEEIEEFRKLVGQRRTWDDVDNWIDVLSGGQKQRVAMARLLYHQPQFAILDECTSAVSVDVEASIYRYCRSSGITLLTVTHRKSLWQHHEFYLHMDGRGNYTFDKIEDNTFLFGS